MSKLLGAFSAQGNFDAELWYTLLFNEIPSKYSITVEDDNKCLDTNEITIDRCRHLFSGNAVYRQYTEEYEGDSDEEETDLDEVSIKDLSLEEVEGTLIFSGEKGTSIYIADDHKIFYVTANKCGVYYSPNENLEEIKKFIAELWKCFPKAKEEKKTARVGLIKFSNGEYYTSFSDIRKTNINIDENYNDDFKPIYGDITNFLNQRESGLILLYGKAGSGNFYCQYVLKRAY